MAIATAALLTGAGLNLLGAKSRRRSERLSLELEASQLKDLAQSTFATGALKAREVNRQARVLSGNVNDAIASSGLVGNQADWIRESTQQLGQEESLAALYEAATGAQSIVNKSAVTSADARNVSRRGGLETATTLLDTATKAGVF